jgi:hypothetical protein
VTIPGLTPGKYQATWWDTIAGAPLQTVPLIVKAGRPTILSTPLVQRDIALYIRQVKY